MNYKDYKRQLKLSKVLNKPLEHDYIIMNEILGKLSNLHKECDSVYEKYYTESGIYVFSIGTKIAMFSYDFIYFPIMTNIITMDYDDIKQFMCEYINDIFNKGYSIHSVITLESSRNKNLIDDYEGYI